MLFEDLLNNADEQDPQLRDLWKLVLNSNLVDSNRTESATRKIFEDRIKTPPIQDGDKI
jgi:hypothetical protein